jgi:hypothetical protein
VKKLVAKLQNTEIIAERKGTTLPARVVGMPVHANHITLTRHATSPTDEEGCCSFQAKFETEKGSEELWICIMAFFLWSKGTPRRGFSQNTEYHNTE